MDYITKPKVAAMMGISVTRLQYIRKTDPSFPKPMKAHLYKRPLRWSEAAIWAWLEG